MNISLNNNGATVVLAKDNNCPEIAMIIAEAIFDTVAERFKPAFTFDDIAGDIIAQLTPASEDANLEDIVVSAMMEEHRKRCIKEELVNAAESKKNSFAIFTTYQSGEAITLNTDRDNFPDVFRMVSSADNVKSFSVFHQQPKEAAVPCVCCFGEADKIYVLSQDGEILLSFAV